MMKQALHLNCREHVNMLRKSQLLPAVCPAKISAKSARALESKKRCHIASNLHSDPRSMLTTMGRSTVCQEELRGCGT